MAITFSAYGISAGIYLGALPFIVKHAGVSPLAFGIIGACAMLSNILAMGLGGVINRRFDHRSVLLVIFPFWCVALLYGLLAGSLWSFAISFLLISFAQGITDLFMNAEASTVEQELGRPVFNGFHGVATLAIAVAAIGGSIVSASLAPWVGVIPAFAAMGLGWFVIRSAMPRRLVHDERGERPRVVLPKPILTLIGFAAGLNVACEVAALQWAGQLLASIAPDLAAISGLGVAFYGLCGGIIRMFGDRLRASFGDLRVLSVSVTTAVAGFTALGMAPGFWPSVIAFAAVGFGLALVFPCLFSLSAKLVPEGRAAAMGYVASVGGFPRVLTPWLLGWLAMQFSLSAVFSASAVVAATALVLIVITFRAVERRAFQMA